MARNNNNRSKGNTGSEGTASNGASFAPTFAVGNAGPAIPSDLHQGVSEIRTGAKGNVARTMRRLTANEVPAVICRNAVYGTFTLNLPFKDGLVTVAAITKWLNTVVENYHKQNQDSFFECWPELLIRKPGEDDSNFTTNKLRVNYKKYTARLAHYYFNYMNARLLFDGCLLNMLNLSRLEGVETLKKVATALKWSAINTQTNMFSRFPQIKGTQQQLAANTVWAVGNTDYQAEVFAIGLWNTTIWGNMGIHSLPADNLITTKGGNGTKSTCIDLVDPQTKDAQRASNLIANLAKSIAEYGDNGMQIRCVDGKDHKWNLMTPRIENGAFEVVSGSSVNKTSPLNAETATEWIEATGKEKLSGMAWNNYYYMQKYMLDNFKEMMDPNGDLFVFGSTQLGLFEKSMTPQALSQIVNSNKFVDMAKTLVPLMKYKGKNVVNTSTIVKVDLLRGGTKGSAKSDAGNFEYNYERYDVNNEDVASMLFKSKEIPGLTPAVFALANGVNGTTDDGIPYIPFVINATPTTGVESADDNSNATLVPSITGKFSTLFDIACTRSIDPDSSQITTLGVTLDSALEYVNANNGVTFEEDPTTVRTFSQPLIDCSDVYQCGFNIMLMPDNQTPSEWDKFLKDSSYFSDANDVGSANETALIVKSSGTDVRVRMHTANPEYMDLVKYAFVFVGAGIFSHPLAAIAADGCASPAHIVALGNDDSAQGKYLGTMASFFRRGGGSGSTYHTKWADAYTLFAHGAKVSADDGSSVLDTVTAAGRKLLTYMFNPCYGPVKPVTNANSFAGYPDINIFQGDQFDDSNKVQKVLIAQTAPNVLHNLQTVSLKSERTTWHAAREWIPFINSFTFRPAAEDEYGIVLSGETAFKDVYLLSQHDYMKTFMAKCIIQFMGVEDTLPFWSSQHVDSAVKSLDAITVIPGSFIVPETPAVVQPRTNRTSQRPNRDYSSARPATSQPKSNFTTASSFITGKVEAHPGKSGSHSRSRGRERRRIDSNDDVKAFSNTAESSESSLLATGRKPLNKKVDNGKVREMLDIMKDE